VADLFQNINASLVTLRGECFDIEFQGKQHVPLDNTLYLFYATDRVRNRGQRKMSVERFGPKTLWASNYDARVEGVVLNVIRRAFDSSEVSFDVPDDPDYFKRVRMEHSDFQPAVAASDEEIRQFIVHTAYWNSYRGRHGHRFPIQFDSEIDLEYLGVTAEDVRRNQWLLEQEGLLEKSNIPGAGRPTAALVRTYDARQSTALDREQIFPKGAEYEAFKRIREILRSAQKSIFIVDNYLDDSVLDMLEALTLKPGVMLLTSHVTKDFRVAVAKFSSQYKQTVEVRIHHKEVHDRAIVIDDTHFYALGASIKDAGTQLFFLNKVQDPQNIARSRTELQTVWASAQVL
jgi:hypothetical protein